MRFQRPARIILCLATLGALAASGCESPQPVAWGPTRTNNGWRVGAGDSVGAAMTQPRANMVAYSRPAPVKDQVATVRTDP